MRATIVRIGATGAGALLTLGLFAAPPAGADGSDKQSKGERSGKVTCFNPEDHTNTQGRSLSDPDGTSNGGTDKPGCADDRVTQWNTDTDNDGNNGCGNDTDREDDNNGNCGHQKDQSPGDVAAEDQGGGDTTAQTENVDADVTVQAAGSVPAAGVLAADASTTTSDATPATVSASGVTAPAAAESTTPDTQVLGETLSAPDTLARTGAGIGGLALLGGLLLGGGRLTVLARRLLRIG